MKVLCVDNASVDYGQAHAKKRQFLIFQAKLHNPDLQNVVVSVQIFCDWRTSVLGQFCVWSEAQRKDITFVCFCCTDFFDCFF